jgi:hypothetical protein
MKLYRQCICSNENCFSVQTELIQLLSQQQEMTGNTAVDDNN